MRKGICYAVIAACAALLPLNAQAADMPTKAVPFVTPVPATVGWSGFYGGAFVGASGTNVDLTNVASLVAGANSLDLTGGWERYDGLLLYGARAGVSYDVLSPGLASFSDHVGWHAGGVVGGNLIKMLGIDPANSGPFPAFLAAGIPYIALEGCGHGMQVGGCISTGMEFVIPRTAISINGEYTHGEYGTINGAPGEVLKSSNGVRFGAFYHF